MKKMEIVIEDKATALEIQIVPQLRWVREAGGPEIRAEAGGNCGEIEICGLVFGWWLFSDCSDPDPRDLDLSSHFHDEKGQHTGWISLSKSGSEVGWSRASVVARLGAEHEDRVVSASGKGSNIVAAIAAAQNWDFSPEVNDGATWYQTGEDDWEAYITAASERIQALRLVSGNWLWTRESKKLEPLTDAIGKGQLTGVVSSRDEAMAMAMNSVEKVLEIARELTKTNDEFEAGKAAGRAELLSEIAKLAK